MGGSGGSTNSISNNGGLQERIRQEEKNIDQKSFDIEVNKYLSDLLSSLNNRDVEKVRQRLEKLKGLLNNADENNFSSIFGGSVAKSTYIEGLSDIDSLIIIDGESNSQMKPSEALSNMQKTLVKQLGKDVKIERGELAITVIYSDGMEIQLLPAFRAESNKIQIPSATKDTWSKVNPVGFQKALTKTNKVCQGMLIPAIKLAKAAMATLPESQRLTGYHVESLAIEAFKNYSDGYTYKKMLPHFFERSAELVKKPITDRTGQSVHVDDYLGNANSDARAVVSHVLSRLANRYNNANAHGSLRAWKSSFGDE